MAPRAGAGRVRIGRTTVSASPSATRAGHPDIVLPPEEFNRLARSVGNALSVAAKQGIYPAVATSARRRRFLRHVLEAKGIENPVLSFEEIGNHTALSLVGTA